MSEEQVFKTLFGRRYHCAVMSVIVVWYRYQCHSLVYIRVCGCTACVDADGKQRSCSRESTPLHADWPPASLSIAAQQLDQSQDGHLSREPPQLGSDAFLTTETGHSERVADQPVPDTVLPSSLVVDDRRVDASVDIQPPTLTSQETRTLTIERKSVPTMPGDVTESSDCVQFASRSEFTQSSHTQHTAESYRREITSSTQHTPQSAQDLSRRLEVVDSATLQRVVSDSRPQSDSTLPSNVTTAHPLISSGIAVSVFFL